MNNASKFITPLSPLRYPGGKRKLAHMIHELASAEGEPFEVLVEPFAGGGAIFISTLENSNASVILCDADPMITAFWKVVFSSRAEVLASLIEVTVPTVQLWRNLRESKPTSDLSLAYKCVILNRTSFSGILNDKAGPIGGYEQNSHYPIGCRFNAGAIAARIRDLSEFSDRVQVLQARDWRSTVSFVRQRYRTKSQRRGIVWYLDPPFFEKADKLYKLSFQNSDHYRLKAQIDKLPGRFILSYDDVPAARAMYAGHAGFLRINLSYNARIDRAERLTASELIVSDIIARLRKSAILQPMGKVVAFDRRRPNAAVQMPSQFQNFDAEEMLCRSTS